MRLARGFAEVKALFCAFVCLLLLPYGSQAQGPLTAADEVRFERDWPAQGTPYYRVAVRGDSRGTVATAREATLGGEAGGVTEIHVSTATRDRLFAVEPIVAGSKGCETGSKKLAQTGKKTITLRRGEQVSTCTFNYSDDKRMQEAVSAFGAIEATVEEGPKLAHLRRFDRLGLDAEIGSFTDAVKGGRAIELGNIAEVLRTLASDGDLMERVRNRATDLLAMADAGK